MSPPNPKIDEYGLIPRLFKRIDALSEQQQFTLLKQLLQGNLKKHLYKAIIDLSSARQLKLLEQLEQPAPDEIPDQPVSWEEETETLMRGHLRKPCLIRVTYHIDEKRHEGYILDISTVGVFIETEETFSVGQDMTFSFTMPKAQQPFNLNGVIVWTGQQGIGVKFKDLSSFQEDIIKTFIEKG